MTGSAAAAGAVIAPNVPTVPTVSAIFSPTFCEDHGTDPSLVLRSADDVALGVRLANHVLTRGGDDLAPQTRRLLAAAQSLAASRAEAEGVDPELAAFTRRELREMLGWSEHQVRVGLARLVALEYLGAVPGGVGRQHRYLLADPPEPIGLDEPRDTPRPMRDRRPRGGYGQHAGLTPDPAVCADALSGDGRRIVGVGTGTGTGVDPDRRHMGDYRGTRGGPQ